MLKKQTSALVLSAFMYIAPSAAQHTGRYIHDLTTNNWKLVLDKKACWRNDQLHAPPVNLKNIKANLPTGGWELLIPRPMWVAGRYYNRYRLQLIQTKTECPMHGKPRKA